MWPLNHLVAEAPPLWGAQHLTVILIIALSSALLSLWLRRAAGSAQRQSVVKGVCGFLAAWLVVGGLGAQIGRVTAGIWTAQESLPLHLCDLAVVVTALALLGAAGGGARRAQSGTQTVCPAEGGTRRISIWQRFYELAYFWGLGGTLQAVVTPDVGSRFPHPDCLRYFALHGGIVVSVLVLTIGLRLRPWPGAVRRVWVTTFVVAVAVMLVNWRLGSNYMYLCGPPANPTLYDCFGRWPYALVWLVLVGSAILWLCYWPFWLADRLARRRGSV